MKITVLGTAQDGGVPQAGCGCENCLRAINDPAFRRLPASLGITAAGGQRFLLDATPALPEQLRIWQTVDNSTYLPDATLITHAHIGHYTGLMYLGKEVLNTHLHPVYVTKAMAEFLAAHAPWRDLVINKNIDLRELPHGVPISLTAELQVTAVPAPHRNEYADTVGFILEEQNKRIFYLPDIDTWEGFTDELNHILSICDYAFLDATFYSHDELKNVRGRDLSQVPHPTVENTLRLIMKGVIKPAKCKIYLTHFNHTNRLCDPDLSKGGIGLPMVFGAVEKGTLF